MVYWIQLELWFIIEDFPVCCVFVFIIFYLFAVNYFQRSSELSEGLANSGEMDEVFFFSTKSYIKPQNTFLPWPFFFIALVTSTSSTLKSILPTSYLPHNLTLGLISWCYTSKLSPAVGYLSLNSRMNLKFFDTVRRIKLFEIPRGEYDQK